MRHKLQHAVTIILGFAVIGSVAWCLFWLGRGIWRQFVALDANLAVGLLTAVSTVLVATLTIVLGRYFERKKEVEAHYRERKTEIYDSFLKEFFRLFHSPDKENVDLVPFLQEWQRQMILWGGEEVLMAFMKWRQNLARGVPDAESMYLTDAFFRAVRRDLGLTNKGLERGSFIRLMLKHPDLFFAMSKASPKVTLAEVAEKEKQLGLEKL
jgi:hypothetical protein